MLENSSLPQRTGLFISFEGIDGVGKSTQVTMLRNYLEARGLEVVTTREPGGTRLGRSLRELLLHGESVAPRAEALLFAADRAQHVAQIILPALKRGAVVITDRYIDSSLAYQSGGRELTSAEIKFLSDWATDSLWPDRTYILDMDAQDAYNRLHGQKDRMESAGLLFAQRTRGAFLEIADRDDQRCLVLDANIAVDELAHIIVADVEALLSNRS